VRTAEEPVQKFALDQRGERRNAFRPAIARAIRYALEQPDGVDVNEVIVRPTAANM